MSEKRFIRVKELAEYLGVSIGTLYVWTCHKKIPYYKVGRLVKFDLQEIDKWVKERKVKMYEYKPLEL